MHVANYHSERKILEGAIAGEISDAAIFLSGPPDFGKTWLLQWLEDRVAAHARVVSLDLADPEVETTPVLVMNSCAWKLGWDYFGQYKEDLARRPAIQAKIENVTNTGDNATFIASAGPTPGDQLGNAIELTPSFAKGLLTAASAGLPIVICLDSFSSAPVLTRSWIERALVGDVARTRCVRLIIAGRDPASPKLRAGAGSVRSLELCGVRDVAEWKRVADELGRVLPGANNREAELLLAGAIDITGGEPGEIMRWLQRQSPRVPA